MTSARHASGTDRLAEVAARRRYAAGHIVVNVQGDEPLIDPALIRAGRRSPGAPPRGAHGDRRASARAMPRELVNPNVVKVVLDHEGYALYFSRAPDPVRARCVRARHPRYSPRPARLPPPRHLRLPRRVPAPLHPPCARGHRALRGAGAAARARARLSHRRRGHAARAAPGRGHARGPAARAADVQALRHPPR